MAQLELSAPGRLKRPPSIAAPAPLMGKKAHLGITMEDLVGTDGGDLHPRAPFSRSRMKARTASTLRSATSSAAVRWPIVGDRFVAIPVDDLVDVAGELRRGRDHFLPSRASGPAGAPMRDCGACCDGRRSTAPGEQSPTLSFLIPVALQQCAPMSAVEGIVLRILDRTRRESCGSDKAVRSRPTDHWQIAGSSCRHGTGLFPHLSRNAGSHRSARSSAGHLARAAEP